MPKRARRIITAAVSGVAVATLVPAVALAQDAEGPSASDIQVLLDNVWILVAAILVIFMQAGFALVEAGLTRAKNVVEHHDEEPDGLLRRRAGVLRRRLRHRLRR